MLECPPEAKISDHELLEIRQYQEEIFQKAKDKNSIIYLERLINFLLTVANHSSLMFGLVGVAHVEKKSVHLSAYHANSAVIN